MAYDVMLLADPGPARPELLRVLKEAERVRPDGEVESRYWLELPQGSVQINVGTKDPVESVHCLVDRFDTALIEATTVWALELGQRLGMRLEDVQWGHEVSPGDLPRLREYWSTLRPPVTVPAGAGEQRRPWWRVW